MFRDGVNVVVTVCLHQRALSAYTGYYWPNNKTCGLFKTKTSNSLKSLHTDMTLTLFIPSPGMNYLRLLCLAPKVTEGF